MAVPYSLFTYIHYLNTLPKIPFCSNLDCASLQASKRQIFEAKALYFLNKNSAINPQHIAPKFIHEQTLESFKLSTTKTPSFLIKSSSKTHLKLLKIYVYKLKYSIKIIFIPRAFHRHQT
jgi:hypothetical protein